MLLFVDWGSDDPPNDSPPGLRSLRHPVRAGEGGVTAPARFRQSDLKRALLAAKSCGYESVRVKVGRDGGMEVIVGSAANDEADEVLE